MLPSHPVFYRALITLRLRLICSPNRSLTAGRSRHYASATSSELENINVEHATQISDSSRERDLAAGAGKIGKTTLAEDTAEVNQSTADGVLRGKLLPTTSHLFKLVLPLPETPFRDKVDEETPLAPYPPTIFLLHPSQPLSHISRLITSSFPSTSPQISFQSSFTPTRDKTKDPGLVQGGGRDDPIVTRKAADNGGLQWSDSTDIGDFVKEAALDTEFLIVIKPELPKQSPRPRGQSSEDAAAADSLSSSSKHQSLTIRVKVPSFGDRTRFLRARLDAITREIGHMEDLKKLCDKEAHRGARRVALSGFGALVVYWGAVARLTFWDVGWDVMEPVTYLSGLSTVILGYLWFLYQGREVSYSSVLSTSILARRQALYAARGFDIQRWTELMDERNSHRREIQKIAVDYDVGWKEGDDVPDEEEDEGDEEGSRRQDGKKSGDEPTEKSLMGDS